MKKGIIGGANVKAHLLGAWEMMPWVGHCINSPNHLLHATLKGLYSLENSSSQPSPCNGNTDLVDHVNQFNQRMVIHSKNEVLMCKVFPSSLGPVAMRWFNGLKTNSVDSYRQLPSLRLSFRYKQQSSSALECVTVVIHVWWRNSKGLLGQILGDV